MSARRQSSSIGGFIEHLTEADQSPCLRVLSSSLVSVSWPPECDAARPGERRRLTESGLGSDQIRLLRVHVAPASLSLGDVSTAQTGITEDHMDNCLPRAQSILLLCFDVRLKAFYPCV